MIFDSAIELSTQRTRQLNTDFGLRADCPNSKHGSRSSVQMSLLVNRQKAERRHRLNLGCK